MTECYKVRFKNLILPDRNPEGEKKDQCQEAEESVEWRLRGEKRDKELAKRKKNFGGIN